MLSFFVTLQENTSLTNGAKKVGNILIKTAILTLAAYFIYHKLNDNENLSNFENLVNTLSPLRVKIILAIVLSLMFLNWSLEAFKWKYLIKPVQRISTWQSIESVFCGLTLAVFTPNRIGEYGGRIFFLPLRKRIFGIVAMGVGAIGQMVVTNVLGAIAILWFLNAFLNLNIWLYYSLLVLASVYCLFFLLLYFNVSFLLAVLDSIKPLRRFRAIFKILSRYKIRQLLRVFLYCVLRFAVFTSQYCFIITLLLPEIPFWPMVMMVFILFFIQSALPSLDLLDVGVRTMTATYFFGFITSQSVAIMAATASIWLINLIIPAILGSVFVFKLNVFGTNHN